MRQSVSLSTRSLLGNLALMVFLLCVTTGVTFLVLTPVFRVMDEDIAVSSVNRLLDSIEMSARNVGTLARGLAESPKLYENHNNIMDSFDLDFLMISDEEGNFSEKSSWIRGPLDEAGKEIDIAEVMKLIEQELSIAHYGDYFLFEAPGPGAAQNNLYFAIVAFAGDGLRRIVIGQKLNPFLASSVPREEGKTLSMELVSKDLDNPVVIAGANLLFGRFFMEVDRDDIVIVSENRRAFSVETVVDVPFLSENILFRIRIPRHSSDLGLKALVQITILHAASFLVIIGLWTLWVFAIIAKPLKNLVRGIRAWDGIRLPDFGSLKNRSDEIGEVARAFIEMSGDIRSKTKSLEDQARRDGLTGLFNRRSFDEALITEWNRHQRDGKQMAIVMADIDDFKSYNDIFGHQAGDECLRLVSQAFGAGVRRPGDLPFRYGGEEFSLILAGTNLEGAAMVAEKIRQSVCDLNLEHSGSSREGIVTMSFGVAASDAGSDQSPETLLRNADDALYSAKRAGKNRVVTM